MLGVKDRSNTEPTEQRFSTSLSSVEPKSNKSSYYEKSLLYLLKKSNKQRQQTEKSAASQLKECTFQPKLNRNSLRLSTSRINDWYTKSTVQISKNSETLKTEKELMECTFTPVLTPYPLQRRQGTIYQRSMEKLRESEERLQSQRKTIIAKLVRCQSILVERQPIKQKKVTQSSSNKELTAKLLLNANISRKYLTHQGVPSPEKNSVSRMISDTQESPGRVSINQEIAQTVALLKGYQTQPMIKAPHISQPLSIIMESMECIRLQNIAIFTSMSSICPQPPQVPKANNKFNAQVDLFLRHLRTKDYLSSKDVKNKLQ